MPRMKEIASNSINTSVGIRRMHGRIMLLVLVLATTTGCQMGNFSLKLNRDHVIPLPEVNVLPEQSEPEILDE